MHKGSHLPSVGDIIAGNAIFSDDMPVWLGVFGSDIWPYVAPESPLFEGETTSSIVWRDYMLGRGATLGNRNSFLKSKYHYCLTAKIVSDLKVAAVIHGHFPKLLKHARSTKSELDPKTVKGRIDELAKLFSLVITIGKKKYGIIITRLDQIPFSLLKEVIPKCPGRGSHLKRALKLISDPVVQKNISSPLQWGLLDITKSSITWPDDKNNGGISPLTEAQFLFLLNHCKRSIAHFKQVAKLEIYDSECRSLPAQGDADYLQTYHDNLNKYYDEWQKVGKFGNFERKYGTKAAMVTDLVRQAHSSSMMLVLLFTGMRSSETKFVMRDSLNFRHGYWFIDSKVVKGRRKDAPASEGWLAVDITRDAYDVLSFISQRTGSNYLFSSPYPGYKTDVGYRGGALNTKFSRWIQAIDEKGLFASWTFSIHQCRETLVFQLAKQEVGMPFLSMQLKHFHSQFKNMPNAVTAGYGQYRSQLMVSVTNRIAEARESVLMDVYGEDAKLAGGGGASHKARIDDFFSGLGLFGKGREQYIKAMARRGVKLMPTSIGSCTKNFVFSSNTTPPPCYGDYQCDPNCPSHVITERSARALVARKEHVMAEAEKEATPQFKIIWLGLAQKLEGHIQKLGTEVENGR